jgi:hypothetical protein
MTDQTRIRFSEERDIPILLLRCPIELRELESPEKQREARRVFEDPGVVVVDGVFDEESLAGLREGLSRHRRKFKDKFNHGLPASETFKVANLNANARIRALTQSLFGYDLPEKGSRSYRPMITENEPLHFDTYTVECGKTAIMSVLNFDREPRVWNVGPTLREVCRDNGEEVTAMMVQLGKGETLSMRLREAGVRGSGPLKNGTATNCIEFAPGSVWYANPKVISHQIVYGCGAQFETWLIDAPVCSCPRCIVRSARLSFSGIPERELDEALR